MQGKTHLVYGVAAGLAVSGDWRGAALGGLAALLPDWVQINVPWLGETVKGFTGHRGISHWLWTPLALAYLARLYAVPDSAILTFCAGYLSHLLLDLLADGIPFLWPLKRITLAHIKTGGALDNLIGGAGLLAIVGLWLSR